MRLRKANETHVLSPSDQRRVLSNKNFNKIFCVGFNKTGTTTLETILKAYGYVLPCQAEQETRLTKQTLTGNYAPLQSFVTGYDAFQDMPFSQGETYAVADALFPNSKFILTERSSEDWFHSLVGFHKRVFGLGDVSGLCQEDVRTKMNSLYPDYIHDYKSWFLTDFDGVEPKVRWDLLYDKDTYIKEYEGRNRRIKKFFLNRPNQFLCVDVTQEDTTEKICDFLNIPADLSFAMPHKNKAEVGKSGWF